jgi:hypothetical protein
MIGAGKRIAATALKTNLVASTGCEKGDILIGAYLSNRNIKIRVFCAQNKGDNLQIKGDFDLLDVGTGKYAEAMAEFVGRHFDNAQELIEPLRRKRGADKCTFILHKDMLQVGRQLIAEETEIPKLQSGFSELREESSSMPKDVAATSAISEKKAFVGWLETLPFPLASILWRYQTITRPKDQFEMLTKFFEALAEFLSTLLLSAVKTDDVLWSEARGMLSRYREQLEKSSFGAWVNVAAATAKSLRTIYNTERSSGGICGGRVAHMLSTRHSEFIQALFSKRVISVLQEANAHRNAYTGHGGILTEQLAATLLQTLQASLAEVQSCYGKHWNSYLLILPTMETHWNGERFNVTAQILKDSRTPFETGVFSLVAPLKTGTLYFLDPTEDHALELLPLIKMDSPPMSEATACYFYNRIQPDGVRYVSYHYAAEAERKYTPNEAQAVLRDLLGR